MAFCPNCGAQVTGTFCPNCGTNVAAATGAAGSAGAGTGAAGAAYVPPGSSAAAAGMSENVAACLCYAPFLVGLVCDIIFLVAAPYNRNKFVRFSAFQSLFLHAALFVLGIAIQLLFIILGIITHGLSFLLGIFAPLVWIAILVLFVVMMIKAYQGQKIKLPIIGDMAERQA
jgi:uncharacterized membrane protein